MTEELIATLPPLPDEIRFSNRYTYSDGKFHQLPRLNEDGQPKANAEFVKAPLRTGHQGYMAYDPDHVRKLARRVADSLPRMMAEFNADTVVVTGKSGISIAYAALMLIDFPLVTVRKAGEKMQGGGSRVEGRMGHECRRYIVLDDLVSTGSTVDNIHEALVRRCGDSYKEPECVGVLVYGDYGPPCAIRTPCGLPLNVKEARNYREN